MRLNGREADRTRPFVAYLAFNAPHDPLIVPDRDLKPYLGLVPYPGEPGVGHPLPPVVSAEVTAKTYAMISNVDANVGRVLDRLDALGLARDTIVVFLSDNGPWQPRYNAGLLEVKGSVHEGGIRVPCFVRWPGVIEPGRQVEPIAAHIDLAPTLLDACGVARPESVAFDGRSLLPLLKGEAVAWPERTLYFQRHRGDVPEPRRAFAARSDRFKLVQPLGIGPGVLPRPLHFELFDMIQDRFEKVDLAGKHPEVVARMLEGYDAWFREVARPSNLEPARIHLGSPAETSSRLTLQDWRGETTEWKPGVLGGWDVEVVRPGKYDLEVIDPEGSAGVARIESNGVLASIEFKPGTRSRRIEAVELPRGPGRLRATIERDARTVAADQIVLHRRS